MLYFSYRLKSASAYRPAVVNLFSALDTSEIQYQFLSNTKDIWLRDFMPVKTQSGRYISFRYDPNYLDPPQYRSLKTNFKQDIAWQVNLPGLTESDINLDGGNVVFSPSKEQALISDRIFAENAAVGKPELVHELEKLLEAKVIIIPSLKSDMTGHADGMVRFLDESTVLCNSPDGKQTLEARIIKTLQSHGIKTIEFPYFYSPKGSAAGCYLNYLETEQSLFLPIFGSATDHKAIAAANGYFAKTVVPINIKEIAAAGGCLHCISWER